MPDRVRDDEERLYLTSCGAKRLQDAALTLRADPRVASVTGRIITTGSYGFIEAVTSPDVATELAHRFHMLWTGPGPVSVATAAPSREEPTWWLRPIIGITPGSGVLVRRCPSRPSG